ncbi:MAG: thiamine pyrophosphate-binding protein [Bacteroidales bacterium]|nr:thiamine pyrophosphate-binding protein [Bacteroidales bacterium]
MTVEELLARRLRDHGVKRLFGIPGGPSIPYMEAFRKEGIGFILTSHEASAAVMADVTARLTGVTGVCHATFGPGATNLSTGVGGALLDRSPMLALTSEMPDEWLDRTAQMNIDHQALFGPLTKATFRLNAANAGDIIGRSLEIAGEEYPGPVHIGLPSDLAGKSTEEPIAARHSPVAEERLRTEERVKVLLASSRRPLIAAGLTAMRRGTGARLLEFLGQHSVPVVLTPMARGLMPSSHPCYSGVLFHALSDRLRRLTGEADLIIGLGYDPVEYNYESWMPDVPLVHFDTRETDLRIRGAIQSVSSPAMWFDALRVLRSAPEMMALAAEARQEIKNGLRAAANDFSPVTALTILKEMLPAGTVITTDVGSHLHLLGQMWDVPPAGRLIMTNGWSSMGFGLPAALAAAFVSRDNQAAALVTRDKQASDFVARNNSTPAFAISDNPVVCITGDGGFLMHAGEMIMARRYGLKVIVVVLSDGELNLIKIKQSWKDLNPYGTVLYTGPLFWSDNYLGTEVIRSTNAREMQTAVGRALASGSSVIIEAIVDPSVYNDLVVRG